MKSRRVATLSSIFFSSSSLSLLFFVYSLMTSLNITTSLISSINLSIDMVVVESLGWLTESTIMPKKHRAIAGIDIIITITAAVTLSPDLKYKPSSSTKSLNRCSASNSEFQRFLRLVNFRRLKREAWKSFGIKP